MPKLPYALHVLNVPNLHHLGDDLVPQVGDHVDVLKPQFGHNQADTHGDQHEASSGVTWTTQPNTVATSEERPGENWCHVTVP